MEKLSSWDMSQNQNPFHYNFLYIFYYIFFSCELGPWYMVFEAQTLTTIQLKIRNQQFPVVDDFDP